MSTQRREEKSFPARGKERERKFWLLFLCLSLPEPVLRKLGQPGLFVLPEVLNPVLGPSFVLFSWAFLFLLF